MSSALSVQHWDISHPNVPTRKVTKQSLLEDKEAYLREGALVAKKNVIIYCLSKRRSIKASLSKLDCPV
jgi:hypothetical protein